MNRVFISVKQAIYLELKSFAFRDYIDAGKLNDLERILIRKRQKMISDALAEILSR